MRQADVRKLLKVLARRIKERRRVLGFTQEKLAEYSGLSTNYIARIEIGSKTPTLGTLVRLAEALGVKVSDLFAEEGEAEAFEVAEYIARSLGSLEESDAEYALRQFRELVSHLKKKQRE